MIRIYPSLLSGTLNAPASKADAQRILFASALPSTPTVVANVPDCEDIRTTLSCLENFGCRIMSTSDGDLVIEPFPKNNPVPTAIFDFKNSATSARFSMALAAAFGMKAGCRGSSALLKRHMLPLTSRMAIRGVSFTSFSLPLQMHGRLEGGYYEFRGDEGSQFISALMLALPLLLSDSRIGLSTPIVDRSFIDITIGTLKKFGITIEEDEQGFIIPGKQIYTSPGEISTENDWALASAWICASAFGRSRGSSMTVKGLASRSSQHYRDLQTLLALISQDFREISLDMSTWPNLLTLVAAAACFKGAKVELYGAPQLKVKETNRLKVMAECIRQLGGEASFTDDGITVKGPENGDINADEPIDCQKDPWIFLSFAMSSALLKKPLVLKDEECADKIYGSFLKDYASLGGKYEIFS